ncbi:MAG TPA: exodeoxyribonuclease V subunit gamma [Polyangiales bacterium]
MGLLIHRSNRLELLAMELAEVVRAPLAEPLARECIVVQGPGMERWLSAFLSTQLGVWANPHFPFPRAILELFLEDVLGPLPEAAPRFDGPHLVWLIAERLPALLGDPAFVRVAAYLDGDRDDERLLDLAQKLADCFDQYAIYRPELLLRWEDGADAHFQAKLYRALAGAVTPLARRMLAFSRALAAGARLGDGLPERISLFGISTLPPAFLSMLARIAEQRDVHVFLLAPSGEYWGDLDKTVASRRDLHGFLASLGKISREFADLTVDYPSEDSFETPPADSMLRALQADMVELCARSQRGDGERPRPITERDDSLRVHVCHSIVRELEVLRDQLRMRFERDKTLEPRDVIVFTPDIERYAPAIEAVFAQGDARDTKHIPFRIADRRALRASEIAEAFFDLLSLLESRFALSDVLDFLHRTSVRERFEIAETELDRIQSWLVGAGARWAIDEVHREQFDQPAYLENSLRFALDRLLVGYAAADGEQRELFGVLPHSEVEGQSALLLGKLARFLETLFTIARELREPRPPAESARVLSETIARMLSDRDELGIEHHALRGALNELGQEATRAGFTRPVSLASIRRLLEQRIDRGRANVGFLAGGITFCEPVPMRAIPFRVVCLLGMDDESFPRSVARSSFDLIAEHPMPGDRSLRDDDRQLFLEALLSARDALHISYVGMSAQDGSERPASVLVDQLLRLCDQHFVLAGEDNTLSFAFEGAVSAEIRHYHGLHRFDARYFQHTEHGPFFTYDERAEQAARAQLSGTHAVRPFAPAPLPAHDDAAELSLDALTKFFKHPQEVYLRERLRIFFPREISALDDREPLALDALDRYKLADDVLRRHESHDREDRARLLRKQGKLAPGSVGDAQLTAIEQQVQEVVARVPRQPALPERRIALALPTLRLNGILRDLEGDARVLRTVGKINAKRQLSAWIEHLALCASGATPNLTRLVGREDKKGTRVDTFAPVAPARAHALLAELVELYALGLRMPLPFFPVASAEYATKLAKDGDRDAALAAAASKLRPDNLGLGVREDPHVMQVWSTDELDHPERMAATDGGRSWTFTELAERVFTPLLECVESA